MHRPHFLTASHDVIRKWMQALSPGLCCWGVIVGSATAGLAVEQVTIEMGPLKTKIQVVDLATFSETGEVPADLALYRPALTPTVRAILSSPLNVEPALRDRVLQDLTVSSGGRPMVELLAEIAPDLSPEGLQAAIHEAESVTSEVTAVGLLQALPGKTLSLRGNKLLGLGIQMGLSYLEQTALSKVLNHELREHQRFALASRLEPSAPGMYRFDQWSVSFRDHDRDRIIPVDMYWSDRPRGPLVVLSHGFGADRRFLAYLAEHLASHGLTVVAIEHPGSNVEALVSGDSSLLPTHEFVERPQDVSFILDRLADLNTHSFFLQGRFNLEQITLIGHSLGGYTGLVLAGGKLDSVALATFCESLDVGASSPADWLQCAATDVQLPSGVLADPRITRLVVMNPLAGQIFGETGLRHVRVPTLFLTGTSDGITSVSDQQLRPFNQLSGPRSLVAVIGGTHLSVGDPENINPALTQVPFMPERPESQTIQLRQYMKGIVLSFVLQETPDAHHYRPFLSADYAKLFSTPSLPIRYSDRLPSAVNRWLLSNELLHRHLTPTWQRIASLLHLEFIDVRYRLATLYPEAIAQRSLTNPLSSHRRTPRSSMWSQAADTPAKTRPQ